MSFVSKNIRFAYKTFDFTNNHIKKGEYPLTFSDDLQFCSIGNDNLSFENCLPIIWIFEDCIGQIRDDLLGKIISLIILYDITNNSILFFGRLLFFTPVSEFLMVPFIKNSETGKFSARMENYLLLVNEETMVFVKKFEINSEINTILVSNDYKVLTKINLPEYRKTL